MAKNKSTKKNPEKESELIIQAHQEVIRNPVFPRWKEWPIVKLNEDREIFLRTLNKTTWDRILAQTGNSEVLHEELQKTVYLEKIRVRQKPWRVDPKDEVEYWDEIKKELVQTPFEEEADKLTEERLLAKIIKRYSNEIVGTFDINAFKFAQRFVPFGFATLLNALTFRNFKTLYEHKVHIQDRIKLTGEIDHIRELSKQGTVIMVPTHFSNLDSILVGWAIDAIGLPPFLYGAGLNLFNSPILAWFMSRLGAYKVDRRKKNLVYLETLKTYSMLSIQRGCHTLFFPGGTRSRSGQLEKHLKMGLLSTVYEAQRMNFENYGADAKKIFIVPMTINYHFVLEAPSLINEYLKASGQQKYLIDSENFMNFWSTSKFIYKFFKTKSEAVLRFGKPMDIFGNTVDDKGVSYSKNGHSLDISEYFKTQGEIVEDTQRDWEYTKLLSQRIVEAYHVENVVLSSHIIAFTAFEMLKKKYKRLDLYEILRLPKEDRGLNHLDFIEAVEKMVQQLRVLYQEKKLQLAPELDTETHLIIKHGLENLGVFHNKKALMLDKYGEITSEDLRLLYYYHNRLEGYGLESYI